MPGELSLTVLTPTVPGRENMLAECVASVFDQEPPVAAQLISATQRAEHPVNALVRELNRLLPSVETEWVQRLDDDNLWLPHHTGVVSLFLDDDVDVLYTFGKNLPVGDVDVTGWTQDEVIERFGINNFLDGGAGVIKRSLLEQIGGFPRDFDGQPFSTTLTDDWMMWRALAAAGARFKCIPVRTWVYRSGDWYHILDGEWEHTEPEPEA